MQNLKNFSYSVKLNSVSETDQISNVNRIVSKTPRQRRGLDLFA